MAANVSNFPKVLLICQIETLRYCLSMQSCGSDSRDLTSCLSRHTDALSNRKLAFKSQPTAKAELTRTKIREDGKDRQADMDTALAHFFSASVSPTRLFYSVLQRGVAHGCQSTSRSWDMSRMTKGQAHNSQMALPPKTR